MIILVYRSSFDAKDPDQEVKLYFGDSAGSKPIEMTDIEKEQIGNAIYSAISHSVISRG